jgi:hypothetical protein
MEFTLLMTRLEPPDLRYGPSSLVGGDHAAPYAESKRLAFRVRGPVLCCLDRSGECAPFGISKPCGVVASNP